MCLLQEKTDEDESEGPTEALEEARAQCMAVAMTAGQTQQQHGMQVLAEDFVADKLKWGLVGVSTFQQLGSEASAIAGRNALLADH